MKRELTQCQLIERSIQKKYRKELWRPFTEAIKKYELIKEGDKIAVCISGGKDSMLMAKMFQLLHRITDFPFELVYMVMDPGYNEVNRQKIIDNAALLEICLLYTSSEYITAPTPFPLSVFFTQNSLRLKTIPS